jgi:DNA-binding transcriptional regulator LsrR (DeoR family)
LYRVVESISGEADVSFVGIGEIGIGCPLQRDGFITKKEVVEAEKAGVVGEIMACEGGQGGSRLYKYKTQMPIKETGFFCFL